MKIKIKTKKELKKMFHFATGDDADLRPRAFDDFITHIKEDMFGKTFNVVEASESTVPLSYIKGMPEFFVICDGKYRWVILNQFVKEIIL